MAQKHATLSCLKNGVNQRAIISRRIYLHAVSRIQNHAQMKMQRMICEENGSVSTVNSPHTSKWTEFTSICII